MSLLLFVHEACARRTFLLLPFDRPFIAIIIRTNFPFHDRINESDEKVVFAWMNIETLQKGGCFGRRRKLILEWLPRVECQRLTMPTVGQQSEPIMAVAKVSTDMFLA